MKRLSSRARLCPICSEPCKKKGVTSAGTQRWYCLTCHFSFTATDTRQARAAQFQQFLDYVTDTQPLRRLAPTGIKAWQRDHAWCWATRPIWQVTGEVYDQVFIDGTYIGYGLCLLTATTPNKIIAYQLCNQETKAAYTALLEKIPAPLVVTTDGDRGALAAIKACWPTSRLQRCLVHIQRNIRTLTTTHPKTDQHKALYKLALDLTKITTADQAIAWQKGLAAFHTLYDTWLAERTYKATVTPSQIPRFAQNNKSWWYTHHATRRLVRALDGYVKAGVLFTYLDPTTGATSPLASTTNSLEGGTNAVLKTYLRAHRGLSEEHMKTALDYFLYTRSIDPQPLATFINNTPATTKPKPEPEPDGPAYIDNAINTQAPWDDGLTIHQGWAGH